MKPTLLVLAAGMGSRYGGLKQMDAMGNHGETVLDYSVFDAARAGFGKVVFVIRQDFADPFQQRIGQQLDGLIDVDYAFQSLDDLPEPFSVPTDRVKPWGTAHAIRAARHLIHEPFAVVNADDFYGHDAYCRMAQFLSKMPDSLEVQQYSMVGYPIKNTLSENGGVNRGICQVKQGLLFDVEEHVQIQRHDDGQVYGDNLKGERVKINEDAISSMNFWGFSPDFFDRLESHFVEFLQSRGQELTSECYIPSVVDLLIKQGQAHCHVLETNSLWFGVTYPDDKPECQAMIRDLTNKGIYPSPLF